jgi:hypothetical protein
MLSVIVQSDIMLYVVMLSVAFFIVMLSVVMLNFVVQSFIMLYVVMLNVAMLSVVAPLKDHEQICSCWFYPNFVFYLQNFFLLQSSIFCQRKLLLTCHRFHKTLLWS